MSCNTLAQPDGVKHRPALRAHACGRGHSHAHVMAHRMRAPQTNGFAGSSQCKPLRTIAIAMQARVKRVATKHSDEASKPNAHAASQLLFRSNELTVDAKNRGKPRMRPKPESCTPLRSCRDRPRGTACGDVVAHTLVQAECVLGTSLRRRPLLAPIQEGLARAQAMRIAAASTRQYQPTFVESRTIATHIKTPANQ